MTRLTSSFLWSDAADFETCSVGHSTNELSSVCPLGGHEGSEKGLATLTEAIEEDFQASQAPFGLLGFDFTKDLEGSAIGGLVAASSGFFEAGCTSSSGVERIAVGLGQGEDGVVARSLDVKLVWRR